MWTYNLWWNRQAVEILKHDGFAKAARFFLGATAHIMQDMCVPHHARGNPFAGHRHYEEWARQHYAEYGVDLRNKLQQVCFSFSMSGSVSRLSNPGTGCCVI